MFARNNVTITAIQNEDFLRVLDDESSDSTRLDSNNDEISISSAFFELIHHPENNDSSCQIINNPKEVVVINDSPSLSPIIALNPEAQCSNPSTSTSCVNKAKKRKKFYNLEDQIAKSLIESSLIEKKTVEINQRQKTRKKVASVQESESSSAESTASSDLEDEQIQRRKKSKRNRFNRIKAIQSDSSNELLMKNADKQKKCAVCDKLCYDLKNHVKRKHNKRNFVCDACGKTFVQKGHLTTHIKFKHPTIYIHKP